MSAELPSLPILVAQVETERAAVNAHGESLDSKAGVVLGFSGVLVGLGATAAHSALSRSTTFQAGLTCGVIAAILATWAFFSRPYPVIEVERLRESNLTAPSFETELVLLDTQIVMITEAASLLQSKGLRLRASACFLSAAATLVVVGTLVG